VERMEMWKKMGESEDVWASKVGLVTLLAIEWKEPHHDTLVEFLNTFVIKGSEIYCGRINIVYVINKQLIADALGVYQSGYIEDPKGSVTKTLAKELLFKHDIKLPYTNVDWWNVKKCRMPINIRYLIVIFVIY